ncbi:histidine kinase-, DNA gyrase B-, and HSP90-like Atpase [Clostridium aceticum]|uniref:Histidine kinase-, DNA gyrase B-, and HSP90-like Atpase n=1 Tax=Clostridium aceticum TaxID=84022 RepID=A0A0G3W6I7_9CLOT|nr:ATP-binding protein [Clostridium aceticum]AKL94326.1 histidine kinase-, DNA gyrase B-, and HSP90-like Atpase [Clostridium aceticum]
MTLFQLMIMSTFDLVGYITISKKLLKNRNGNKWFYGLCILVFSFIGASFTRYIPQEYSMFINAALVIYMFRLLYKRRVSETIYLYILSVIIILCVQLSVIILLETLSNGIEYIFFHGIIAQSIAILLVMIVSVSLPIHLMFQFIIKNNKVFKLLIFNLFVLLITILFYWHVDISSMIKNIISLTFFSTGAIFVNFILLKNGLKNQYEEQQLQVYEKYLPVIDELIKELRARQHEFDNHIQALKMITVTSTNYEDIMHSMKKYTHELEIKNDLGDLIKLNNKVLAGFLYNKRKLAKKLGVDFEIIIEDYAFIAKLKNFELVEVVGNLINNAFETGIDNNVVKLILSKEKDMYVIEIRNKHPYLNRDKINTIFKKGFSTKPYIDRGYGLYNLKKIVNRYNGEIEVLNEEYDGENYLVFRVLVN